MAALKPYVCKHCGEQTDKFSYIRLRFMQYQYEHSYGREYPKESKEIDNGEVPVFLCNSCIKEYFKTSSLSRIKIGVNAALLALVPIAIAFVSFFFGSKGFSRLLCASFTVIAIIWEFMAIDTWNKEMAEHVTRHLPKNTYLGQREHSMMMQSGMVSYNEQIFKFIFAIVTILGSIFIPDFILLYLLCAIGGTSLIYFIVKLISLIKIKKNMADNKVGNFREDAIRFFFKYDDGIELN